MKCSTIAKTFIIAAVTALALGVAPTAKAHDKACSKATLKGNYTHIATGFFTSPRLHGHPVRRRQHDNLRRKWRFYGDWNPKPKRQYRPAAKPTPLLFKQ